MKWIEWVEPFGPNNEPVYLRVTKEVAIAFQKASVARVRPDFIYSDEQALSDFITVHWASEIEL